MVVNYHFYLFQPQKTLKCVSFPLNNVSKMHPGLPSKKDKNVTLTQVAVTATADSTATIGTVLAFI